MPTHWRVSRCSIPRVCVRSSVKAVSSALAWLRTGIALFGRADIVQEGPSDSTTPPAQGRRLGGGAIASLSGIGLLVIFMIQNTERVRLDFLFWSFIWALAPRCGVGTAWGVGMVRIGRDAPSPASQGAPPSPTGLTLNRSGLPRRTATTLPGVSSSNLVAAGPALSSENVPPKEAHRRGHDGAALATGSDSASPQCSQVREHQPLTWQCCTHPHPARGSAGTNPQPGPGNVAQQHVRAGERLETMSAGRALPPVLDRRSDTTITDGCPGPMFHPYRVMCGQQRPV
jgi:hypothetical protein